MPSWGCGGSGRSTAPGPYMTGVSINRMLSAMKLPTTNVFIENKVAHNLFSIAPLTIDVPTAVLGALTSTLFMPGGTIALFPFTVIACGAPIVRWLCLTLHNLWNSPGFYDKMDQNKLWVFSM